MKPDCAIFRAELERRLAAASDSNDAGSFADLGWHEHLLACAACRELLDAEEALDVLLASLPEPRLPRRLTERLLLRLRKSRAREGELDQLLALDAHGADRAPAELSSRITAGVRAHEARAERDLDALLDRVPVPDAPAELASRVLARLDARRASELPALDRLLDRAPSPDAPTQLAARVLGGLAQERVAADAALDRVLQRDAALASPEGLGARVLAGLASERSSRPRTLVSRTAREGSSARGPHSGRKPTPTWVWAAAAGLLATLTAWLVWPRSEESSRRAPIVRQDAPGRELIAPGGNAPRRIATDEVPRDEVLAALDVLEQWDLLMKDDVDVLLSTFAPADESLLEVESTTVPVEEAPVEPEPKLEGRKG